MKRVTPESSYSTQAENLYRFALLEMVILPALVTLISIVWYSIKADAGALAEKGIGLLDIDAGFFRDYVSVAPSSCHNPDCSVYCSQEEAPDGGCSISHLCVSISFSGISFFFGRNGCSLLRSGF